MDGFYVQEARLMHRFYADPEFISDELARLTPEDAHHAINVLRLFSGDQVEVIDRGVRWQASIVSADSHEVLLSKEETLPSTEPSVSFTLFQGIPKGDKMEMIVQKAVELGVSRIVPVIMSRCVVRLDRRDAGRKQERWQKIAREAGKQSARCMIPEVVSPVLLSEIAQWRNQIRELVVPWEMCEGYGPAAFCRDHPGIRSLGIVIGPEGGISAEEISFLSSLQARIITLGRRILRTETAGLAAVSAFSALYGEME